MLANFRLKINEVETRTSKTDLLFFLTNERLSAGTILDCSQSPIFPCDRRDRARLTVNGGHLDFQSYRV